MYNKFNKVIVFFNIFYLFTILLFNTIYYLFKPFLEASVSHNVYVQCLSVKIMFLYCRYTDKLIIIKTEILLPVK